MPPALVPFSLMLTENHRTGRPGFRAEQDVEGLRRGHQDMRRKRHSMRAKAVAKSVLNKLGVRERFNDSRVYEAYLFLFMRPAFSSRRAEEGFYRRLIKPRRALIFDIGASHGSKAHIFSKLADRVICVRADPQRNRGTSKAFSVQRDNHNCPEGRGGDRGDTVFAYLR